MWHLVYGIWMWLWRRQFHQAEMGANKYFSRDSGTSPQRLCSLWAWLPEFICFSTGFQLLYFMRFLTKKDLLFRTIVSTGWGSRRRDLTWDFDIWGMRLNLKSQIKNKKLSHWGGRAQFRSGWFWLLERSCHVALQPVWAVKSIVGCTQHSFTYLHCKMK